MFRCAARALATRLGVAVMAVAAGQVAVPAWAADPLQRSARLLWSEAGRYLDLTPAQRQTLEALQVAHGRRLQGLSETEARAEPAGRTGARSAALCQQATTARAEWLAGSRAVLTPPQLARLAQLEAAFLLMPVIESAQAAGLLDDRVALPPRGLPEGRVAQEASWLRVPAAALPGCPAAPTTVAPEVARDAPDAAAALPRH